MVAYKKYTFLILILTIFCSYRTIFSSFKKFFAKFPKQTTEKTPLPQKKRQEESIESFIQQNKELEALLGTQEGVQANIFKKFVEEYAKNSEINTKNLSALIFQNPNLFTHFYSNDFINLPKNEKLKNSFSQLRFTILEHSQQDRVFENAIQQVNEQLYVDILKISLTNYLDDLIHGKESDVKKLKNYIIQLGQKLLLFKKDKQSKKDSMEILNIPPFSTIFNEAEKRATSRPEPQISWSKKDIKEIINNLKKEIAKETILDRAKIASEKFQSYLKSIAARISNYYYRHRKK